MLVHCAYPGRIQLYSGRWAQRTGTKHIGAFATESSLKIIAGYGQNPFLA